MKNSREGSKKTISPKPKLENSCQAKIQIPCPKSKYRNFSLCRKHEVMAIQSEKARNKI